MTDHTPSGLPQPQTVAEFHNPWRTSLENCISGDNYLRAGEYRDLIADLDRLYALEQGAPAPAVETVAVQEEVTDEMIRAGAKATFDFLASPLPVAPKAEPERLADCLECKGTGDMFGGFACDQCFGTGKVAQPVAADTPTDAEVLEYCDTHPEATFAQAVLALASPPRAIPAEQAAPTEATELLREILADSCHAESETVLTTDHYRRLHALWQQMLAAHPHEAAPTIAAQIPPNVSDNAVCGSPAHPHEAADRSAEAKNAARWRYAMDWATKDFAVCYRDEDAAWTPMKTNGPIDAAMGTPAAAEPGKGE